MQSLFKMSFGAGVAGGAVNVVFVVAVV